ncbi:hypothetical protein Fmac_025231 [Flemingia macrophylla]|uniref:Uncharacterized protein n=1 Tax=Flemingia macrophylla TaxID=520843 RepID=A0ABD1LRL5_9FABA
MFIIKVIFSILRQPPSPAPPPHSLALPRSLCACLPSTFTASVSHPQVLPESCLPYLGLRKSHLHGSTLTPSVAPPPFWPPRVAPPRLHPESCVHSQGLPVDNSTAASPEIYSFTDPNPAYAQSPFELSTVENGNNNGNGYGTGEGIFVFDGLVLPLPTEMEPEEGYALPEWRR